MKIREYNTQRTCGVWLLYIGVIIIISAISGGELLIQPVLVMFFFIALAKKTGNFDKRCSPNY